MAREKNPSTPPKMPTKVVSSLHTIQHGEARYNTDGGSEHKSQNFSQNNIVATKLLGPSTTGTRRREQRTNAGIDRHTYMGFEKCRIRLSSRAIGRPLNSNRYLFAFFLIPSANDSLLVWTLAYKFFYFSVETQKQEKKIRQKKRQ